MYLKLESPWVMTSLSNDFPNCRCGPVKGLQCHHPFCFSLRFTWFLLPMMQENNVDDRVTSDAANVLVNAVDFQAQQISSGLYPLQDVLGST